MKFSQFIFLAILQTAMVVASPQANASSAADEAGCGDLGVMTYNLTDLPEGVDPTSVRKCANHPLAMISPEIAARDGAPANTSIDKRACWHRSPYGCTKKYCWKTCGPDGQWCWTAHNGGWGPWIGCNTFRDCDQGMECGEGGCKSCGCNCYH